MSVIKITELPESNHGKNFWPWEIKQTKNEQVLKLVKKMPKVSIVTPSFNQGRFIEETIRSVLLQEYPNLEYIIIDGGSSDNTLKVINKYKKWISYWVSEPDKGQSEAINKGFKHATGEIYGWINSDDLYAPEAIYSLVQLRENNPGCVAWVGACRYLNIYGKKRKRRLPMVGTKQQFANWNRDAWIPQPSCLFDAKTFNSVGGIDETLDYVMDVDLWIRLSEQGQFAAFDRTVSYARIYDQIKTKRNVPMQQAEHILINFKNGMPEAARDRMARCMEFALDGWKYRKLLRYFLKRTVSWLTQLFLRAIGK